jgi:hypothetical protein
VKERQIRTCKPTVHPSQRLSGTTGQSGDQSFDTDSWRRLAAVFTSSAIESAPHLSYHLAASCFHGDLLAAAATDLTCDEHIRRPCGLVSFMMLENVRRRRRSDCDGFQDPLHRRLQPPSLPVRLLLLLPAGATIAGWGSHPLKDPALTWRANQLIYLIKAPLF